MATEESDTDAAIRSDSSPTATSLSAPPAAVVTKQQQQRQAAAEGSGGTSGGGRNPKKRKRKVFLFGNYDAYYNYRGGPVGSDQRAADPRLQLLQRAWFEGRSVLDIGCNSGLITFALAEQFSPRSILGIDIDGNLIRRAQNRLARLRQDVATITAAAGATSTDVSTGHTDGQSGSDDATHYPHNVEFRTENFVARKHRRRKHRAPSGGGEPTARTTSFEIILCLSVTKWVHLNWGDAGLKTLFRRVWESLPTDGTGLFILEPQPWYVRLQHVAAAYLPLGWVKRD